MGYMKVPDDAVTYILFQRTSSLRFTNTRAYRVLDKVLPFSIYDHVVRVEGHIRKNDIKSMYDRRMREEYDTIKNYLPKTCSTVLDIGCGVAGIDVFINEHFQERSDFYLLDRTHIENNVYYMFSSKGAFYNSLPVAKQLLIQNGISEENIHLLEAREDNDIRVDKKINLVISLISWGFHYPLSTYLDRVYTLLEKTGSLILDVRKGTGGFDELKQKFSTVDVIADRNKFYRTLAIK